ncbi:uncharacterized protein LOC112563051 [Pomacea canaliculata]|uniref:uncharacterized protein LOC112563051 n=1 Tax=Pomacea canaliculata TaxID=400727 RepID=UPI000D725E39|nr:uncharacterized protein LOC112563051 [Pomacea canaliculata]
MLSYLAFLGVLCVASAQLHHTCHSNAQQLREEEVIALVADLLDRNNDGIITAGEFVVGFGEILGYQFQTPEAQLIVMNSTQLLTLAAQYGIVIDKEHFVQKWHQRFGDSVQFARATFEAYDDNKDDKLSVLEIENIRLHALARADNGDNILNEQELKNYLKFVYSC